MVYKKADELHAECLKLADEIKKVEREKRGEGEIMGERGTVNKILLESLQTSSAELRDRPNLIL